ncbi:3-dehydroquinate synthase [Fructobacillus pseudoficulneus]|uniref:3-dehydroquinate synthase n=1 Tax=Fructobacillus pseudoficulneus TaxID=220714 RepID=A0A3F3GT20_9LACO|nr:3-dehydroquinate synthase [Fructobacillus pseudoficulneus]GAP02664.1 3-dehydroquinate synthase [Fructobacillus pseudoficulneus]SEH38909.1 3-dehydroquinate synthase [Fructobacillus pseudoficulneus]
MKEIVVTAKEKDYTVKIAQGLLASLGAEVAQIWSAQKVFVVTDDNVATFYLEQVVDSLVEAGFQVEIAIVAHGEAAKSVDQVMAVTAKMAQFGLTRTDGVLALGGGVIGDLAGFVASIYMRGIGLIQVPTSFLAQVDSSVGGKTAIDAHQVKNLLGSFYPADLVLIDPMVLKTLPERELIAGYGEVVKAAALVGGDFWRLICQVNAPQMIITLAEELIEEAVSFKAAVVMADEHEGGKRRLLNFGHTIGHGVEALSQGELRHGEAVSIGMVAISRLLTDDQTLTETLKERLKVVGLPSRSPLLSQPDLVERIRLDKKNRNGQLAVVYLTGIGQPQITSISVQDLAKKIRKL